MSAERLIELVRGRGLTLAVAEGDTGGLLLELLTAVPGSSAVALGGVVAYHDDLKRSLLRVAGELIAAHGAVSRETVEAMAHGVRSVTGARLGLATTGIAGPGGATASKPVGLAFVSVTDGERTLTREHQWNGSRAENRASSAEAAIVLAIELVAR